MPDGIGKTKQYYLPICRFALLLSGSITFSGDTELYVEPVLNQKSELNALKEQINAAKNEVLKSDTIVLKKREEDANKGEGADCSGENARISTTAKDLEAKTHNLELVVVGLKLRSRPSRQGKGQVFFVHEHGDPIYWLKSYGWNVWR